MVRLDRKTINMFILYIGFCFKTLFYTYSDQRKSHFTLEHKSLVGYENNFLIKQTIC